MPLSRIPPKRVRCATPGCRFILSNERVADKFRRCAWCIEAFAKSEPRRLDPKLLQGTMFVDAKPPVGVTPIRKLHTRVPPMPAPAPEVAPPPTAAQTTAEYSAKLNEARIRADHDPRAARLRELRALGLSLPAALEQIEQETTS